MDWSSVSGEELLDALREVEWSTPPRPLPEFFQKFTSPKSVSKWTSRLKCNLYYFRTNYVLIIAVLLSIGFFRNPLALVAVLLALVALLCLNDSFAIALSERITRSVRRLSPPLAARMRPPASRSGVRGRPLKGAVYICGQDRRLVVAGTLIGSIALWYYSSAFLTVFTSLFGAFSIILLHASFRSPNLKARLNSFREEFRALWRGYSDAP